VANDLQLAAVKARLREALSKVRAPWANNLPSGGSPQLEQEYRAERPKKQSAQTAPL